MNKPIDMSVLRENLSCNILTGKILRLPKSREKFKSDRGFKVYNNRFANTDPCRDNGRGYLRVHIHGKDYMAHKIVWAFAHGEFPDFNLDHINHNKTDNRICNLRPADYAENNKNKSIYCNNTSGVTGVTWHKRQKKWTASIFENGKRYHIGSFDDIGEARKKRIEAQKKMGFHRNHGVTAEYGPQLGMEVIEL